MAKLHFQDLYVLYGGGGRVRENDENYLIANFRGRHFEAAEQIQFYCARDRRQNWPLSLLRGHLGGFN